jgi:hypothetical protein
MHIGKIMDMYYSQCNQYRYLYNMSDSGERLL